MQNVNFPSTRDALKHFEYSRKWAALRLRLPLAKRVENYKTGKAYANDGQAFLVSTIGEGRNVQRVAWFNSTDEISRAGWRFAGYADKLIRLNHTGWYADSFQNCTIRAIVAQLPARNGSPVFLAGHTASDWDSTPVYVDSTYDSAEEAARAADRLAEVYAEQAREDDAKQSAEAQIEELREQVKNNLKEIAALREEWRKVRACAAGHTLALDTLRGKMRELAGECRRADERIEKLADNFWLAVQE